MIDKLIKTIKKRKNLGFTLVEVMVAAAILSLVVAPILSSFVAIARVNAKSRRKLSATTIANSVMESVKGFELSEVSKQCNDPSNGFHVIAGSYTSVAEVVPEGESASYSTSEAAFSARTSGQYEFKITGVQMDGTKYDVVLKYKKNEAKTRDTVSYKDSNDNTVTKTATSILTGMGVRVLTYYDVEINVYKSGATTNPLATLTGSKADYTPAAEEN